MQGYSSTDRRGSLLNDWDLQEIGSSEASEVISSLVSLITPYLAAITFAYFKICCDCEVCSRILVLQSFSVLMVVLTFGSLLTACQ